MFIFVIIIIQTVRLRIDHVFFFIKKTTSNDDKYKYKFYLESYNLLSVC